MLLALKINLQVDYMKIAPIFGKKLYAFKYPEEDKDEFARLFELWNDSEYLEEFFEINKSDLQSGYWRNRSVEDAIFDTIDYAQDFEDILIKLSDESESSQKDGLESIFSPLSNSQYKIQILDKSKAKENWLRIYALRVERDIYIITGGAIKLTRTMQERVHTEKELHKIDKCRRFLLDLGIIDSDGLIEEVESYNYENNTRKNK